MTSVSQLGVVALQWNKSVYTTNLLRSLANAPVKIVISDNGSDIGEIETIAQYLRGIYSSETLNSRMYPWQAALVLNKQNSGFAAGMNLGIRTLLKEDVNWFWLLNNDTNIPQKSLTLLLNRLEQLEPGLYGTKMSSAGVNLSTFGNTFHWLTSTFEPIIAFSGDYSTLGDWYIDGASILIHRKVIEDVGLLSEDFFLYFEELDYKRRAEASGYFQKILPSVIVDHIGAGSSSESAFSNHRTYHETYSTLRFYQKHHAIYLPVIYLVRTAIKVVRLIYRGRLQEVGSVLSATKDFTLSKRPYFVAPDVIKTHYFSNHE